MGDFSRCEGGRMSKFLAGVGDSSPICTSMENPNVDYLTKTSIINLKEFAVNNMNYIVWESNLSIRTKK